MDATTSFCNEAEKLLGPAGFTRDAELMAPWLTDWRGRYTGQALGLASPADTAQVAALLALATRHRIAVVPQGGNSGMSGGATPDGSGTALLLSLRRMNRIHPVSDGTGQIVCEAGVILQNLHDAAANAGMRFALTLGGKGSATIGGLIATNAGGTQVLRHGTMRAQVLGLEAVLPDGQVYDGLGGLVKDNRGFDLKQLFIGSEGTLGIVTAARLRLVPAIAGRTVAWAGTNSIHKARDLLLRLEAAAGHALEGFEVLPRHSHDAVMAYAPAARPPLPGKHDWHVLMEFVTPDHADMIDTVAGLLAEAVEAGVIQDAVIAQSESQAEAFWSIRDAVSPAERAIGPALQHDIAVPPAAMPAFIEETVAAVEARFAGTRAIAFGHLGDGNVHFHAIAPAGAVRGEWEAREGLVISRFIHDRVTQHGGTISAEHGIGQMKTAELARLASPAHLHILRQVKAALDPLGIMNPGKLVPLETPGKHP